MIPAPYPWRCIRLPPCPEPLRPPSPALWDSLCIIRYRQKKVTVSYCFDPILYCPSLAALFDDRREEFSRVGSKG